MIFNLLTLLRGLFWNLQVAFLRFLRYLETLNTSLIPARIEYALTLQDI